MGLLPIPAPKLTHLHIDRGTLQNNCVAEEGSIRSFSGVDKNEDYVFAEVVHSCTVAH